MIAVQSQWVQRERGKILSASDSTLLRKKCKEIRVPAEIGVAVVGRRGEIRALGADPKSYGFSRGRAGFCELASWLRA